MAATMAPTEEIAAAPLRFCPQWRLEVTPSFGLYPVLRLLEISWRIPLSPPSDGSLQLFLRAVEIPFAIEEDSCIWFCVLRYSSTFITVATTGCASDFVEVPFSLSRADADLIPHCPLVISEPHATPSPCYLFLTPATLPLPVLFLPSICLFVWTIHPLRL